MPKVKAKAQDIATVKDNGDGTCEVTLDTLKEMVANFREFVKKQRNLPTSNKVKSYAPFAINAVQYVHHIIVVTTELIEQGVIESDPYGFLTANVKSFDKANNLINTYLIPDAKAIIAKEHEAKIKEAEEKGKEVSELEKELTPTDIASVVAEPTEVEDRIVEIMTASGRKWVFDKKNYTLAYRMKNGNIKYVQIAKKGTWRATAIDFLAKCIEYVRSAYNTVKDRCIGIKQTIQFKWLQFQYTRAQARQAKAEAKEAKVKAKADKKTEASTKKASTNFADDIPMATA